MPALRHRCGRNKPGQSLLEFAILAPLMFLLIFGIIDIARLLHAQVTVSNAARQSIRFGITGQEERNAAGTGWIPRVDSIRQRAIDGMTGLPLSNATNHLAFGFHQVEINPIDAGGPNQVIEVNVYYNLEMLTPLVNIVLPRAMVHGFERAVNEEWGAVQSFDHANLPPLPPPLPTWTPIPTNTPTPTTTATAILNTPTPTPTHTPSPTNTPVPSNTATATPQSTVTVTP